MKGAPTPSLILVLVVFTVRGGGEMNWSPSFHGRRFILGIEMASHGTRGFLNKEWSEIYPSENVQNLQMWRFPEAERLHQLDTVPVITVNPGQVGLPDLDQLVGTEPPGVGLPYVVVEPVPSLPSGELVRHNTAECGACSTVVVNCCNLYRQWLMTKKDSSHKNG